MGEVAARRRDLIRNVQGGRRMAEQAAMVWRFDKLVQSYYGSDIQTSLILHENEF